MDKLKAKAQAMLRMKEMSMGVVAGRKGAGTAKPLPRKPVKLGREVNPFRRA